VANDFIGPRLPPELAGPGEVASGLTRALDTTFATDPSGGAAVLFYGAINELVSSNPTPAASRLRTQPDVLARLINLTSRLTPESSDSLYQQGYFATKLLMQSENNSNTVAAILDDIDYSTSRNSPIYTVMRGLMLSVTCLALAAGFSSLIYLLSGNSGIAYIKMVETPIIVAPLFGMLGSIVSILLRLSEFETATRRSRQFLRMTGMMLPLVGAIFACVSCAVFASGIINFGFASADGSLRSIESPYFYVVIGFLSGFSERFTRGLLGNAENILTSQSDTRIATTNGSLLAQVSTRKEVTQLSTDKVGP